MALFILELYSFHLNRSKLSVVQHQSSKAEEPTFIGKYATLNINPETGAIVTIWRTGTRIIKILERIVIVFTLDEKKYLNENLKLNLDFNHMSDDDWIRLEETVGDRLTLCCLDENYNPNEEGLICERILDKLP